FPLSALTADSYVPGVGSTVDIVALLPFKPDSSNIITVPATWQPDSSRIIETVLLRNAQILYHGSWPDFSHSSTTPNITFAVSNNDRRLLAWLGEQSDVKFRLQKPLNNTFDLPADSQTSTAAAPTITPTPAQIVMLTPLPPNLQAVSIPRDHI